MLTSKQRQYLKKLAHERKPVILIGKNGVTDGVVKETASALQIHELLKVKLPEDDEDLGDDLARQTSAEIVAQLGRVLILYKERDEEPTIELPKDTATSAPRPRR